jgi:hypothetical protein
MDYFFLGWIEIKLGSGCSLESVLMIESVNYTDFMSFLAVWVVELRFVLYIVVENCGMWIIAFMHVNNKLVSHNIRSESLMKPIWNPLNLFFFKYLLRILSKLALSWRLFPEYIVFKYAPLLFKLYLNWLQFVTKPMFWICVPKWFAVIFWKLQIVAFGWTYAGAIQTSVWCFISSAFCFIIVLQIMAHTMILMGVWKRVCVIGFNSDYSPTVLYAFCQNV